ncbi:hypothetical protein Q766_02380 [Flavobacterium subsaxonicum WB 4.1-42 = DSM 21790]|uniref:Lipoprotein n=2 Tax=Flavobacterium TaxID=237 RepID=A0A0A2MU22_9FLAO|nr:hypothetical protein Q766_02380 [Flavobacterium subsaxonicum WB 4.1-42 = DSM 21790]
MIIFEKTGFNMRIFLILCIALFLSCIKNQPVVPNLPSADTNVTKPMQVKTDTINTIEVTLNDSVLLKYPKIAYFGFESWFKDMVRVKVLPPNDAWRNFTSLDQYNDIKIYFSSEIGQDDFCLLYAYFLQQLNGVEKYQKERLALFSAYRKINKLKWYYQHGGTYFGHMHDRIYGYAEFSVYAFDKDLVNNTNISKEKSVFISQLKKTFIQKLKEDADTMPKDRLEHEKEMIKIIDEMSTDITNAYLLKELKQFYADNYDYWM